MPKDLGSTRSCIVRTEGYKMSLIGLLGDVHGRFDVIFDIIKSNPDVTRWFQIGDLGGEDISYPEFPICLHFIQGNHENWDYISTLKDSKSPLFQPNGSVIWYMVGQKAFSVGVLGGNFSSANFDKKTSELSGGRRRHFTREDIDSLMVWYNRTEIDILLTHEAPTPFFKGGRDIGVHKVTEIIESIRPDIHFFGHHHMFKIMDVSGVVSVGLDYAFNSYVLYDTEDKRIRKIDYER